MSTNYLDIINENEDAQSMVAEAKSGGNHEMNLAWQFITKTNVSVFLTGKAGTGKTTFLRKLREISPKRMVVLAPTGVAAINAQGQTIHSFFQLPTGPRIPGMESKEGHYRMGKEKKNLIKTIDLLVVDEISMVRCDVLDAMDAELRKYRDRNKPFGGVQLLLIGDLQQLAPVAQEREWALLAPYYSTPYFFGSRALSQIQYVAIELKHIYRQQDTAFIDILAKVRSGMVDDACLNALNARYNPNFVTPKEGGWIRLTTHNAMAQQYNDACLNAIEATSYTFRAIISGNFPEKSYPADETLTLKVGAQVMFIKNDPSPAKRFYNGKIGTVTSVTWDDEEECQVVMVHSHEDGQDIAVFPLQWENTKYTIDEETKEIKEEVDGTFVQHPLRLAWAITVHKSQGLTFEHAVLDITSSFTHGQTYVALSRCRTLEGMVLARPISRSAVIIDSSVNAYIDKEAAEALRAEEKLPQMMEEYYYSLLSDMFDFRLLDAHLVRLLKVVNEHLYGSAHDLLTLLLDVTPKVKADIVGVAGKFKMQYTAIMRGGDYKTKVQERVKAASAYFDDKLRELLAPVFDMTVVAINNQQVKKLYNNALEDFTLAYTVKRGIFKRMRGTDFTITDYLNAKAKAALDDLQMESRSTRRKSRTPFDDEYSDVDLPMMYGQERGGGKGKSGKSSKPKKEKVDTKTQTLALFQQGLSVEEIAKQRSLTTTTIESHLSSYVASGEVDINRFVSQSHQKMIAGVIRSFHKAYTLSEVKSLLPDDYTFGEIRMVQAWLESGH